MGAGPEPVPDAVPGLETGQEAQSVGVQTAPVRPCPRPNRWWHGRRRWAVFPERAQSEAVRPVALSDAVRHGPVGPDAEPERLTDGPVLQPCPAAWVGPWPADGLVRLYERRAAGDSKLRPVGALAVWLPLLISSFTVGDLVDRSGRLEIRGEQVGRQVQPVLCQHIPTSR